MTTGQCYQGGTRRLKYSHQSFNSPFFIDFILSFCQMTRKPKRVQTTHYCFVFDPRLQTSLHMHKLHCDFAVKQTITLHYKYTGYD